MVRKGLVSLAFVALLAVGAALAVELGGVIRDFGVNSQGIGVAVFSTDVEGIDAVVRYLDVDASTNYTEGDKILRVLYFRAVASAPPTGPVKVQGFGVIPPRVKPN